MEKAALRYARWVLIAHVALLAVLLLIVAAAVRLMYAAAHDRAMQSATQTQELLARQTGLGIQNYYETIADLLQLIQPDDDRSFETRAFARFSSSIWEGLRQRASLLFVADPAEDLRVVKIIGVEPGAPSPQHITTVANEWIKSVDKNVVSHYLKLEAAGESSGGAVHLVCVPMRGAAAGLMLVAVVPVSGLERNLLENVNRSSTTGALLVDHSRTFVSAALPDIVGHTYTELSDPRTRMLAEKYFSIGAAGTEVFDRPGKLGDVALRPGMSTIQPIHVLGQRWALVISSDLAEVDKLVTPVFRGAMIWAGFVMLAMTGILVSTAIQMIRSRIRVERMQHEMLNKELVQAREIQLAWLPHNDDDPPNVDLCAINLPASHISGDFYNWFQLSDGRTVVVIGDVTGHGIAAAFLMATTQLLVRTTMPRVRDPAQCLEEINRQLCVQVFNGQFVTMQIVVLDVERGVIEVATAGHPPPLIAGADAFRQLPIEPQLMLAVERDTTFHTQRFDVERGSSILLYTDGVPDALSPGGERFRIDGLMRSLYARYESAQAIIDTVVDAVDRFRGTHELTDDVTLVAVQFQPARTRREPTRDIAAAVTTVTK